MNMFVTVTEKHHNASIKAGTVGLERGSAIDRAIRGAGIEGIRVGGTLVRFNGVEIDLPTPAALFSLAAMAYGISDTRKGKILALKAMRSLLPFEIRVPKPESGKK